MAKSAKAKSKDAHLFTARRDTLAAMMANVRSAIDRKAQIPILANCLVTLESGHLTVIATDMDTWVSARCDGVENGMDQWEAAVPAEKLYSFLRALPEKAEVTVFEVEAGRTIRVSCGRSRVTLPVLPGRDFPRGHQHQWDAQFALPAERLEAMLDRTAFAMAGQGEARIYLAGVHLHRRDDGCLVAVAGQGHIFSRFEAEGVEGDEALPPIIVPAAIVPLIAGLCDGAEIIGLAANAAGLEVRRETGGIETTLISKLVDATYPDYPRMIGDSFAREWRVNREALSGALGRVACAIDIEKNGSFLRMGFGDGALRFAMRDQETESEDEVSADLASGDGETYEIGVNHQYLRDIARTATGKELLLRMNGPTEVIQITSGEGETFLVVPRQP